MGFHNEISSSSHRMLQSSSYCSCGIDTTGMLDSSTFCGSCSVIEYACMLVQSRTSTCAVGRMTSLDDDATFCSASGASSFCCAYCQASPAALVASPSSGVPLSPLDQSIWSNIHGDTNFPRVLLWLHVLEFSISIHIDEAPRKSKMWAYFFWLITAV